MAASKPTSDRSFSYQEFRQVSGLSKKEADGWVQRGLITAELAPNGRRRLYRFESLMEGAIAKGLADFASRELLENMMKSLREFLAHERIRLHEISFNPAGTRLLVQIYTQISKELMPGGGVRGVVTYVKRYDPSSQWIGKPVFVVVDLTIVALVVRQRIGELSQG